MQSALVLAATPIGSSEDASSRLCKVLEQAEIIAAEDTRVLRKLLLRLGVTTNAQLISYFEGNETSRIPELIEKLRAGASVVLVSDAGMPSVSDPGFKLVKAAIAADLAVTAVPGPSAVLTALAVSGLPTDRFCFEGFLPRKTGDRKRRLNDLTDERRTMVFFEAPRRLADFLVDAAAVFGSERQAVICRELTKPHEEIIRSDLGQLINWASGEVRGEVTVVIAGASVQEFSLQQALELVQCRIADGQKLSSAVKEVAEFTAINRGALYTAAVAAKKEN